MKKHRQRIEIDDEVLTACNGASCHAIARATGHAHQAVKRRLQKLCAQGRIRAVLKGRVPYYEACTPCELALR